MPDRSAQLPCKSGNVTSLVFCALALLCFVMLGLYPTYRKRATLRRENAKLKARIDEQELLFPFATELTARLRAKPSGALPSPKPARLPYTKIPGIQRVFAEIAQTCGLAFVRATPDSTSIVGAAGRVSVSVAVNGDFARFREFLLKLGTVPYVEHLETIGIRRVTQGSKEMKLQVWLAIE